MTTPEEKDAAREEAFMHDVVASVLPALRELPEALDLLRALVRIDDEGGAAAGEHIWKRQHDLASAARKLLMRISPLRVDRVTFNPPIPDTQGDDEPW